MQFGLKSVFLKIIECLLHLSLRRPHLHIQLFLQFSITNNGPKKLNGIRSKFRYTKGLLDLSALDQSAVSQKSEYT